MCLAVCKVNTTSEVQIKKTNLNYDNRLKELEAFKSRVVDGMLRVDVNEEKRVMEERRAKYNTINKKNSK